MLPQSQTTLQPLSVRTPIDERHDPWTIPACPSRDLTLTQLYPTLNSSLSPSFELIFGPLALVYGHSNTDLSTFPNGLRFQHAYLFPPLLDHLWQVSLSPPLRLDANPNRASPNPSQSKQLEMISQQNGNCRQTNKTGKSKIPRIPTIDDGE